MLPATSRNPHRCLLGPRSTATNLKQRPPTNHHKRGRKKKVRCPINKQPPFLRIHSPHHTKQKKIHCHKPELLISWMSSGQSTFRNPRASKTHAAFSVVSATSISTHTPCTCVCVCVCVSFPPHQPHPTPQERTHARPTHKSVRLCNNAEEVGRGGKSDGSAK